MYDSYLRKGEIILKKLNIKTKDISSKKEIEKSTDFNATLKPSNKKNYNRISFNSSFHIKIFNQKGIA